MTAKDKRRERRLTLTLPVRVLGHDATGKAWDEMATTIDISVRGCATTLQHKVQIGQILQLSMPFPRQMRQHELTDGSYTVYGLVRWLEGTRVGMLFRGRQTPKGYSENPGGLYLMPEDENPAAVREHVRFEVRVEIKLRRLEATVGPSEELTITETLGEGGAAILTSLPVVKGERLELQALHGPLKSTAEVVSISIGPDQIPRLNVRFLDDDAPERIKATLRSLGIFIGGPETPAPASAAPSAPIASGLRIHRDRAFRECLAGEHELCLVGLADPGADRFALCACTCHGAL
jgi:hypothetical protein